MAKPIKHHGNWRIRWTDATGKRRSQTFTEKKTAELALRKAELEPTGHVAHDAAASSWGARRPSSLAVTDGEAPPPFRGRGPPGDP